MACPSPPLSKSAPHRFVDGTVTTFTVVFYYYVCLVAVLLAVVVAAVTVAAVVVFVVVVIAQINPLLHSQVENLFFWSHSTHTLSWSVVISTCV